MRSGRRPEGGAGGAPDPEPSPVPEWALGRLARVVYGPERIRERVEELARSIARHYGSSGEGGGAGPPRVGPERPLVVLGLLKGSFIFLADLVREIPLPVQVDFVIASSYGAGTTTSGRVELLYDPGTALEGRHVVVVEDIVDSGTTLRRLLPLLESRGPASVQVCALLHKRRTALEEEPRWVGFEGPDEFLVGYGLDHAEDFRHLPFIASLDR